MRTFNSDHFTVKTYTKTNIGEKTDKLTGRVLNLSVTHPCMSGQWFEFLMHSDYDLQQGHLPDDVILVLIDQNPSGVSFPVQIRAYVMKSSPG